MKQKVLISKAFRYSFKIVKYMNREHEVMEKLHLIPGLELMKSHFYGLNELSVFIKLSKNLATYRGILRKQLK